MSKDHSPHLNDVFRDRHIGTDARAQADMLTQLGYSSVDDLMSDAVPQAIRTSDSPSALPVPLSERAALRALRQLAARNTVNRSMIGQGYYGTITPTVIQRNVLENPGWYTAYTPYQPEISQGRLEALITFQTMVTDLTGLDIANSSMLDEATAVVEAMLLARRASRSTSSRFLIDADTFPQTRAVLRTRAAAVGIDLVMLDLSALPDDSPELAGAFGMLLQYPASSGRVWDPSHLIAQAKAHGVMTVIAADLLALTMLRSPGELGADIAAGTSQRLGVPMGFGGPHAGYLAVRHGLERQLPGRLVGVSHDAAGQPAYRLTLQTREQHIRREKATSNICTAQVLLAVMAAMYAVYHGPAGLRAIGRAVHASTRALAATLTRAGVDVVSDSYFDTLQVRVDDAATVVNDAHHHGILLHDVDSGLVSLSLDEEIAADLRDGVFPLAELVRVLGGSALDDTTVTLDSAIGFDAALVRTSEYLTHPVFSSHHSETAMMRYLRLLQQKDYALDRGMIPLGSCTMKLNAATEMQAVTWPEFAAIHPFAPMTDVAGTLALIDDVEMWLADVTGYDTVSLQPNAGSQGELAGLLAIRGYHLSRGEGHRTVCLIPQSAHGTNAASAVLAGLRVVGVATDDQGNVDLDDLRAKITEHASTLAALMITYPSTHGVYEQLVTEMTDAVHAAGGQVYVDGANLNALLGYARFGDFGGDVSHLNLHKTFCIPHGGGGPGVGPVAARAHLAPFLPGHPLAQRSTHRCLGAPGDVAVHQGGPVSAAPYGSPSILPITWAYIRMMGEEGLAAATGSAVLAANYLAARLGEFFPVLYTGERGLVAHECILDLRPLQERTGVTVDDVAKRLIDFGFHAPTMSFPVAGTLMIEPTESEDKAELDRFVEAMIAIRREADAVADGRYPVDDSPLRNAPHTALAVVDSAWSHAYTREEAAYPVAGLKADKYWSPVGRVDQAYGDRNVFCSCPPVTAFAEG